MPNKYIKFRTGYAYCKWIKSRQMYRLYYLTSCRDPESRRLVRVAGGYFSVEKIVGYRSLKKCPTAAMVRNIELSDCND